MAYPAAPTEAGGAKIHPIYDNNAGVKRANGWRAYQSAAVDGDQLAEPGVYPTSGRARTGKKATTGSTEIQLTATSIPCQGMLVKASPSNASTLYVGITGLTTGGTDATDGYPLEPGESVGVPCRNANEIYVRGAASGLTAFWMASAD